MKRSLLRLDFNSDFKLTYFKDIKNFYQFPKKKKYYFKPN